MMSKKGGSKVQKIVIGGALLVLGYVIVYTVLSITNSIIANV